MFQVKHEQERRTSTNVYVLRIRKGYKRYIKKIFFENTTYSDTVFTLVFLLNRRSGNLGSCLQIFFDVLLSYIV